MLPRYEIKAKLYLVLCSVLLFWVREYTLVGGLCSLFAASLVRIDGYDVGSRLFLLQFSII